MKYLLLTFMVFALKCGAPKKTKDQPEKTPSSINNENENTVTPTKNYDNEIIVIPTNTHNIDRTKEMITNSGLTWKSVSNESVNTIGIIEVPSGKRDFWIPRLQGTGEFKLVTKYSQKSLDKLIEFEKNKLISLRKTACFGDCPVYDVSIDKFGQVTYNGIKFVNELGERTFKLSEEEFEQLNTYISEKDFSTFKNIYDNPRVMDLPSTYISHKNKQIKIRLWKNIPDELIVIHEYIEELLLKRKLFE